MAACTYCGCEVTAHDPVYVAEGEERAPAGQFCNYACLAAHIEEADLAAGAVCRLDA
ncbi:MAG: hypothetical protein ABEI39_00180 [Halobacteriales archaeon]